ncbi:MAG TPA: UbiD family decarboxylase, partial [Anaerolineae bacterium]
MSLRAYLQRLEDRGSLIKVTAPISKTYEVAGVLKQLEPKPVLFEHVKDSAFRVMGNLFCRKAAFAAYFGIQVNEIIPFLAHGIDQRRPCEVVETAPCQEVVVSDPDLDALPILRHCENDGGNYISSGVVIARHPKHGQNVDFHRCMQFSRNEMAVRVVRSRHFDTFLR